MIKMGIVQDSSLISQYQEANREWQFIFAGKAGDGVKYQFTYAPWTPSMTLNLIRKKMIKLKRLMLLNDPDDEKIKDLVIPDPVPHDFTPSKSTSRRS